MTRDEQQERFAPLASGDPRTIGSYRILGVLGSGGMGVVYFAEQERPRRSVAVKVLRRAALRGSAARRFELEAELLGRLQHPGIAQIIEASADGEGHAALTYLAMEYIDGVPLSTYAERHALDASARLRLLVQLADAVQHAHQRGVLHRDLKPGNVLVTADGQVKVIDFGVARVLDEGGEETLATLEGDVVGTIAYMSPEQIRGEVGAQDTRVDVYALGVIAYELFAGRPPFDVEGQPITSAIEIVCKRDAVPLGRVEAGCRGDLEAIVAKCLEKDPERRYPSASALAADLRRYLAGEPVQARAAGSLYQLAKLARRNRALVVGSATTVAALVLGLAGTGWGLISARKANRDLESSNRQLTELNTDLERVAGFQAEQLSGLDVLEMAVSLRRSTLDRTAAEERENAERALSAVNFVDVAQESLEAHLFRPSLSSIERSFQDQPLVRAQLLQAVTDTAIPLGLFDLAREAGEQALALRSAELGRDAPETLASMLRVSQLLREVGEYDASEELIRECLAGRTRLFGADDLKTLAAMSHLAVTLQEKSELDDAAELFRAVLDGSRRAVGEDDPRTQRSALNLSSVLARLGRYEEAESLTRAALEWRSGELGPDHRDTLTAKEALSNVLDDLGEFEAAVKHAREALELRRRTMGNRHPDTAISMSVLGSLLQRSGQRDEAGELFREALASRRENLGEGHPSTMMALARLADWELDAGHLAEAEDMYRRSWEGLKRSLGPKHPRTMRCASSLGQTLNRLGRSGEAEPLYRMALENAGETLGERHPTTLTCLSNLGVLLIDLGQMKEAAVVLREALDGRTEVLGPTHPSTLNSYYNLGHLMHTTGELEQAKPLLRYALEQYSASVGPDGDGALFSAGKLAQVLLDDGEFAEAEALFRDVYERRRALFDEAHPSTVENLDGLVLSMQAQDKWDELEELLLAHFERCEGEPALEPSARRRLAELYWARHAAEPGEGFDALAESWR